MNIENLLLKIENEYDVIFYEEAKMLCFTDLQFVIRFDYEEKFFSIYKSFLVPLGSVEGSDIESMKDKLLFLQKLYTIKAPKPEIIYELSMGCPNDEENVGYFDISIENNDINSYIQLFVLAEIEDVEKIDFEMLKENYPEELEKYYKLARKMAHKLTDIKESGWRVLEKYISTNKECTFINLEGSVVLGIDEFDFNEVLLALKIINCKKIDIYNGINYAIGKTDEVFAIWDMRLIKAVETQIERLKIYYESDIDYYMSENRFLIIRCSYLWAVIMPIKIEIEKAILSERDMLMDMQEELRTMSSSYYTLDGDKVDFERISASEFEDLCKEVLNELGFVNIFSRGNVNASDGGVDIECDEEIKEIFGVRKRHWIFQCKHTKKQLDRKDVSEIPCLLKEFNAEGYGLFYTSTFTPQTVDRLKSIDSENKGMIQYWDNYKLAKWIKNNAKLNDFYLELVSSKSKSN